MPTPDQIDAEINALYDDLASLRGSHDYSGDGQSRTASQERLNILAAIDKLRAERARMEGPYQGTSIGSYTP